MSTKEKSVGTLIQISPIDLIMDQRDLWRENDTERWRVKGWCAAGFELGGVGGGVMSQSDAVTTRSPPDDSSHFKQIGKCFTRIKQNKNQFQIACDKTPRL